VTERITFSCSDELAERLHEELDYGDNRSELIRELVQEALDAREASADPPASEPDEVRSVTYEDTRAATLPASVPATVDEAAAQAAIDAVVTFLRDKGRAGKADIVASVMAEHDLGYDVPADPSGWKGSWWRKVVRPALQAHENIEPPAPGGSEYRWNNDER